MSSNPGNLNSLYLRVTDTEIRAIPRGVPDKAAADWLGVSVLRVRKVRENMPQKVEGRATPEPTTDDLLLGSVKQTRHDAKDGSARLLRRQLQTGQLPIRDRGALAILRNAFGVAA